MQNKQQEEESRRQKHDADSGNDGAPNEILETEKLIDPGNEHDHSDKNVDRSLKHDADSGGDATGTAGPEPAPGISDEDE